jgi:signal peptidase II
MRVLWITAGIVLLLDQVSKYIVVHRLNLRSVGDIDVWPPYLNFRMAWNRGVNFGLLADEGNLTRWILIVVAVAITVWVLVWMWRDRQGRWAMISGGLLVGGAVGNVIDRLTYGAVADFLNMSCCGLENPYAFNVADIAIFAGALGLVLFTSGSSKTTKGGKPRKSRRQKTP